MNEINWIFIILLKDSSDSEMPGSPTMAIPSVKLRSTGLADCLRSPTNGYPRNSDAPKSPILKSMNSKDKQNELGIFYFIYLLL